MTPPTSHSEPVLSLAWQTVSDRASLRALAPAWDRLCGERHETLAPAWVLTWLETLGRSVTPYVLVGRDALGEVVAVLPLMQVDTGELVFAGAQIGALHGDIAARADWADAAAADALALLRDWRGGGIVRLRRLGRGAALARATVDRKYARCRLSAAAPSVTGFTDFEQFLAHCTKHVRHEVRRHVRRFAAEPGAHVHWVEDPGEVEPALRTLFDLHARRFESGHRETSFYGAELRRFHLRLARRLFADGRLLLGLLRIGERSIAAAYGWHRGARTTLFQMGFDPDQATYAPGTVLAAHVLREQVFGQGRTSLDLGEGCYPWKLHWSTTVEHQVDIELHGQGAPALVRRLSAQAVVGLRAWAGAHLRGRRCHGQAPDTAVARSRCAHAGCDFPTGCPSRAVSQSAAQRDA